MAEIQSVLLALTALPKRELPQHTQSHAAVGRNRYRGRCTGATPAMICSILPSKI